MSTLRWDIHPSIIERLGAELISDEATALMELVKNSYDADSKSVRVTVQSDRSNDQGTCFSDAQGYIVIEDDGHGMDLSDVERGWLTISNSHKRKMKRQGKRTERFKRTPLGDKGLGRLGAHRLGENVELLTRKKGSTTILSVAFSWKSFNTEERLSEVPIDTSQVDGDMLMPSGTKIVISGLKNPQFWSNEEAKSRFLTRRILQLLSPYEGIDRLKVHLTVNGRDEKPGDLARSVRDTAIVNYRFSSEHCTLVVEGRVKQRLFAPTRGPKNENWKDYERLIEPDSGLEFFEFLMARKQADACALSRSSGNGDWYLSYRQDFSLDTLDAAERDMEGALYDPGPFRGEIDVFNLGFGAGEAPSIFDSSAEYKEFLKHLSGIRVYRDGFGISVAEDWLGLSRKDTEGGSWYGMRAVNTAGFIALTAAKNGLLIETTDREGFAQTPYFSNFEAQLARLIKFDRDTQEFLRRTWSAFKLAKCEDQGGVQRDTSPEDISRKIQKHLGDAEKHSKSVEELRHKLSKLSGSDEVKAVEASLAPLEAYLSENQKLAPHERIIQDRIKLLRHQLEDMYEAVGLGLTAESLLHETKHIADRLGSHAQRLKSYLKEKNYHDEKLQLFVEQVRESVTALRKQISYIDPALKYVRDRKKDVDIAEFAREVQSHHQSVLSSSAIRFAVQPSPPKSFNVRISPGKLTQVVDNLVLNSVYWLKEDLRAKRIDEGMITIELDAPYVRVFDNGTGVDPTVEGSLFEPFVTAKGLRDTSERGRGLGLFIVQQLLDSEGASIRLLPELNRHGRRYKFEIYFQGGARNDKAE